MSKSKFSVELSKAMDRQGVNLSEVAEAVGMPVGTLFNWTSGRTAPGSMSKVGELCEFLSIHPRDVLNV